MRKRKYLIGALLGVIGSVVLTGTASATVTSQSVSSIINPAKAPKKTFVAVKSMKTTVDTNYSGGFTPNGTQTIVSFSKDVKFTPGNIAQCNLSTIARCRRPRRTASCGASRVGTRQRDINGGAPHRQGGGLQRHAQRSAARRSVCTPTCSRPPAPTRSAPR